MFVLTKHRLRFPLAHRSQWSLPMILGRRPVLFVHDSASNETRMVERETFHDGLTGDSRRGAFGKAPGVPRCAWYKQCPEHALGRRERIETAIPKIERG